ncbi:MAG: hypothetical protein ACKO01_09295 [Erythrobacter sp.]
MSLPEIQVLLAVLSGGAILSAAWLVLHARDVALLLRPAFPGIVPGKGRRLARFDAVCAAITLLGFSLAGEVLVIARATSA